MQGSSGIQRFDSVAFTTAPYPMAAFVRPDAALVCAILLASNGAAQPLAGRLPQAPLIPLDVLFSAPAAVDDAISPDGTTIAWLAPWRGRLNVHISDTQLRITRRLTDDSTRSIVNFWWSADGTRIVYLQDRGGDAQFHLFSRAIAGQASARDLTPFSGVEVELLSLPANVPAIAVITMNRRSPQLADAYRVNLATGALEEAAQNPGDFLGYVADANGHVRVAYSVDSSGRYALHARHSEHEPWRLVRRYAVEDRIVPLRFHTVESELYMISNAGTDLARLVLVELATGTERLVHGDPLSDADIESPFFDRGAGGPLFTAYQGDTMRTYPHTAAARTVLELARRHIGEGTIAPTSVSRDGTAWILTQSDPDRSARTWLVHTPSGTMR